MRTIWIVSGMRRSGLHAFTDWLMAGLDGPTLLLNNVRLNSLHHDKRCVTFSKGYESSTGQNEHIVVIFEDKRLPSVRSAPLLRCLGGPEDEQKHLVVIRDPYNLTASPLRRYRTGRRGMPPRNSALGLQAPGWIAVEEGGGLRLWYSISQPVRIALAVGQRGSTHCLRNFSGVRHLGTFCRTRNCRRGEAPTAVALGYNWLGRGRLRISLGRVGRDHRLHETVPGNR